MNPMAIFAKLLGGGGGIKMLLFLALLALIWFGAAALGLGNVVRYVILGIVIGLMAIRLISKRIATARAAAKIEKQLREQAQAEEEVSTEKTPAEIVRDKFNEAMQTVRFSQAGTLSELPWFVMLGHTASGKTTAIQRSGLSFPAVGQPKTKSIGGTRHLDWWFTDSGILVDTAGRYVEQDADEDREEWNEFVNQLERQRDDERPIHGVVVSVAADRLLSMTEEQIDDFVQPIRDRIDDMLKRLDVTAPVYVLFTKMDMLRGFTEFFSDLTKQERAQIWGATLPFGKDEKETEQDGLLNNLRNLWDKARQQREARALRSSRGRALREAAVMVSKGGLRGPALAAAREALEAIDDDSPEEETASSSSTPVRLFEDEIEEMSLRLQTRRLEVLAGEQGAETKQAVYLFPQQFQIAQKRFSDFIRALFRPNPFQETPPFRGFYFVSGTQKGKPIEQMTKWLNLSMGGGQSLAGDSVSVSIDGPGGEKKSFFLNKFFDRVLFSDDSLVRRSAAKVRRMKAWRAGVFVASLVVLIAVASSVIVSFNNQTQLFDETRGDLVTIGVTSEVTEASGENFYLEELQAIDGLRDLIVDIENAEAAPFFEFDMGISRTGTVREAVEYGYFRRLRSLLVVPAGEEIVRQMRAIVDGGFTTAAYFRVLNLYRAYNVMCNQLPDETADDRDQFFELMRSNNHQIWLSGLIGPGGRVADIPAQQRDLAVMQLAFIEQRMNKAAYRAQWTIKPSASDVRDRVVDYIVNPIWVSTHLDRIVAAEVTRRYHDGLDAFVDKEYLLPQAAARIYFDLISVVEGDPEVPREMLQEMRQSEAGDPTTDVAVEADSDADDVTPTGGRAYRFPIAYTKDSYYTINSRISDLSQRIAYARERIRPTQSLDEYKREIRPAMQAEYVKRYQQRWETALDALELRRFPDIETADRALQLFAGRLEGQPSPYEKFIGAIWEGRQLHPDSGSVDTLATLGSTDAWLPDVIAAIGDLAGLLDSIATAPVGERIISRADGEAGGATLDALAKRFGEIEAAIEEATSKVEPVLQARVKRIFRQLLFRVSDIIRREAADEASTRWRETIATTWQARFDGKVPFAPEGSRYQPETHVTLDDFFAMFTPTDGQFWQTLNTLRLMQATRINGRALITFTDDLNRAADAAELLRDALFTEGPEEIRVPFRITWDPRDWTEDIDLRVNDSTFSIVDDASLAATMMWRLSPDATTRWRAELRGTLLIDGAEEEARLAYDRSPWGFLRLLNEAEVSGMNGRERQYTWYLDLNRVNDEESRARLVATIRTVENLNPLDGELFRAVQLPIRAVEQP